MSEDRRSGASPGDRAIDAAWRRASTEEPSARVDAAILDAARAAARSTAQPLPVSRPAHRRWAHWRPLAAAAAVAALALLLVPRAERESVMLDAPMRAPLTEAAPPATQTAPAEVSARGREAVSAEESALSEAVPAAEMPQGAAETVFLDAMPVADEVQAEAAAPGPAMAPSRGAATAATDVSAGAIGPQQWVDRVASLHAAGDLAGAAAALRGFRRAYPDADAHLPPALGEWAAEVPQEP